MSGCVFARARLVASASRVSTTAAASRSVFLPAGAHFDSANSPHPALVNAHARGRQAKVTCVARTRDQPLTSKHPEGGWIRTGLRTLPCRERVHLLAGSDRRCGVEVKDVAIDLAYPRLGLAQPFGNNDANIEWIRCCFSSSVWNGPQ